MTAAILHEGKRSVAATGITNIEHPVPVTTDTRFQIGSISKVFTATAIMVLAERSQLDLDTPVSTWVPDLPLKHAVGLRTLTLRHLLNHTTGFEGDMFFDTGSGDDALVEGVRRFDRLRHWTVPGEIFAYCNTGFYLAGRIIEVIADKPFEDVVTELVIEPLELQHTSFASADLVTWPTASGHTLKDREVGYRVYRPWALPRVVNAAGGIVSTVDDLLDFAEMHMAGGICGNTRILSEGHTTAMRQRTLRSGVLETGFGIGWNLKTIDGTEVVGHNGATNGFRAALATVPERGFALAMLANGDPGGSAMEHVQRWALQHHLDIETSQRDVIAPDSAVLDAVTGHYDRHDAAIDVWRVDDHLHIERRTVEHEDQFSHERSASDPPSVMTAWATGEGVFRVLEGPFKDTLIEFVEGRIFGDDDDDTLVNRQLMRAGGRLAVRTGDAPVTGPAAETGA
ncbi:MAG: beta-lactamase family protein [Chloroflexota bacterium]|nr:beta-lactamase family protein [Chloroflexota bacterium]